MIEYCWIRWDVWDFPEDEPIPHVRIYAQSRWGQETWSSFILDLLGEQTEFYVN